MKRDQSDNYATPDSLLHVIEVDPQADPNWEAVVMALPNGSIYHHPVWLQVLMEAYSGKSINLACKDVHGQLRGVLPIFYKQGLFTGHRFSSLPRTPVAGTLAYDDQVAAALVRAAIERVHDEPGALLQIKTLSSDAFDGLTNCMAGLPERTMYLLELPEQLIKFPRLDHRVRNAVNKASRLSVEVHPAETERELQVWYELYLETMCRNIAPPRPYYYFKIAWNRLWSRGDLRLLLAKHYEAGRPRLLGGLLLLMCNQTVYCAEAGWSRENQLLRPNDALFWCAIQDACEEGFRYFNLGEVPKNNKGLARYKSKWGAEPRWLYSYYYPALHIMNGRILAERNLAHWLTQAAWRWLPHKTTTGISGWVPPLLLEFAYLLPSRFIDVQCY